MGMFGILKNKLFYRNLVIAVVVTLSVLYGASFLIDLFTRHGKEIKVSDMLGMTPEEVSRYIDDNGFRVEVLDSVFTDAYPKGSVCKQDPAEGSMVKRGRKIYISYVARQQEMTEMPNLNNITVRQAVAVVYGKGLTIGRLIYEEGFDRNAVQRVICNGKSVAPGTEVAKGSRIDLYVSKGVEDLRVAVPRVAGLEVKRALIDIYSLGFNVSKINYDRGAESVPIEELGVYRQIPVGNKSTLFSLGTGVELWVKPLSNINKAELKIDETLDSEMVADSLSMDLDYE